MVGLAFLVVGIGASMIYFFWNRCPKNVQRRSEPIADNNKTNELEIIQKSDLPKITIDSECKKEVEIKPPEKEKAGKELQLKNEEKRSFVSLNSDDLGAPVPASKEKGKPFFQRDAFNNNALIAVRQRKDTIVSNNNLEGNNMCMGGSKPKKKSLT